MTGMSTATRSRIGFIVVILIIAVIGTSAYLSGRQFLETNAAVTETLEIQLTLSDLLTLVVDAETGGRGFFITGDESYLEPYIAATENIEARFTRLRSLLTDRQSVQRVLILRDLVNRRLRSIESSIERRRHMTIQEALEANATPGIGKAQMDEIRRLVSEMQTVQENLLSERLADVQTTTNTTSFTYAVLTLLAAVLLGTVYLVYQRSFAESKRTEAALEARVTERTRHVQFLADASAILAEPSAYQQKLNQLAQMSVQNIADTCILYFPTSPEDPLSMLDATFAAHRDPEKLRALTDMIKAHPPGPNNAGGVYAVYQSGKPIFYSDIDALAAAEPERYGIMQKLGMKSLILVPMNANGKRLGVLSLTMMTPGKLYSEADLVLAEELADRAGLLIENGRLFNRIRQLNADLEQRVKERTQQLEHINHELETFNYSVSHDLRAPLRSIDGFSQALLEDFSDTLPPTATSYLNRVRAAAQRMGHLIDDLLGLSRLTRVEMNVSDVDVSEMARGIVAGLEEQHPARTVAVTVENDLHAQADKHLINILLENLIGNAWKFTSKTDNAHIHIGKTTVDEDTVLFVRDNGAGFDMAYADRLFGAFERLHSANEFEGTGIGLATVQRIVNRHGGTVWAEGKPGEGATFYFKFPTGRT